MSRMIGPTTPPDDERSPEALKLWHQEEYQEGLREGRLWVKRDCVRIGIETRFGEIRPWANAVIEMTYEVEVLDRCFRALLTGSTLEEALEILETCLDERQKAQTAAYLAAARRS